MSPNPNSLNPGINQPVEAQETLTIPRGIQYILDQISISPLNILGRLQDMTPTGIGHMILEEDPNASAYGNLVCQALRDRYRKIREEEGIVLEEPELVEKVVEGLISIEEAGISLTKPKPFGFIPQTIQQVGQETDSQAGLTLTPIPEELIRIEGFDGDVEKCIRIVRYTEAQLEMIDGSSRDLLEKIVSITFRRLFSEEHPDTARIVSLLIDRVKTIRERYLNPILHLIPETLIDTEIAKGYLPRPSSKPSKGPLAFQPQP